MNRHLEAVDELASIDWEIINAMLEERIRRLDVRVEKQSVFLSGEMLARAMRIIWWEYVRSN